MNITIKGVYQKTIFRNEQNGYTVFLLKKINSNKTNAMTLCVGFCPRYRCGIPLSLTGKWEESSRGQQFKFKYIEEDTFDREVSIEFLSSSNFFGVGVNMATSIVNTFGNKLFNLKKSDSTLAALTSIKGISLEKAVDIIDTLNNTVKQRELYQFIIMHFGTYNQALKIYKKYGSHSIEKIKTNPYEIGAEFELSLLTCDSIAKACGFSAANVDRLSYICRLAMANLSLLGHVYSTQEQVLKRMQVLIKSEIYKDYIPSLNSLRQILTDKCIYNETIQSSHYYLKYLRNLEINTASQIKRLMNSSTTNPYSDTFMQRAEEICGVKYAPQQLDAFDLLQKTGVGIVTGGPGTGKTTVIKGIILAYKMMFPHNSIKLCAPTGRAAQRMSESTGEKATTIHRLLEYCPYEGNERCNRNYHNPIDADFIIIDESSMLDIELASLFFSAVANNTFVLLVGDINQLPSVGPGDVLNDLIASNVIPVRQLTKVYRQAETSPIVSNARTINEGNTNLIENKDFQIIQSNSDTEMSASIIKKVAELYDKNNPFSVQVLAPTKKGPCGTICLNQKLQETINPGANSLRYGHYCYRVNDKIIMLRNNYKLGYFNGDVGTVKGIQETEIIINIQGQELRIPKELMEDMSLAYCMTIHKSQGSEFVNVIVSLPKKPDNMLKRNLLYTGITRAKNTCYCYVEDNSLLKAIATKDTGIRQTTLSYRLQERGSTNGNML